MLTGHAQSMWGGVKGENPMGKGKLGNGIITAKVFVKILKRSVVDMAFKPTSKVAVPSKTS